MSYTANYNTVTLDPLLSWSETVDPVFTPTGKEVTGYKHTFQIDGFLLNTAVADQTTDINTLLDKLRESGGTLTIDRDGTDIRTFQASDVKGTGPHPRFEIPAEHIAKQGFNVPVLITITGETDPTSASAKVADSYTDRYAYDVQNRRTFTRRGRLSTSSGNAATDEFDGTDPSPTPAADWELQRKEYSVDEDDRTLDYSWEYIEVHKANPIANSDVDWQISSTVQDGTERWTATGTIRFNLDKKIDAKQVKQILAASDSWPNDLQIVQENVTPNERENSVAFSIEGERPYGTGGTLEYEESVETVTIANIRDFKAIDESGKDVRQTLTTPEVTVIQTGRWVKTGAYPLPPDPVLSDNDAVIEKRYRKERILYDVKGKARRYPITWTYTMRPLNQTGAGQWRAAVDPGQDNPLQGAQPKGGTHAA